MSLRSKSPNGDRRSPTPVLLCIGGWDPSAGAGVAMDLRVAQACGVTGLGVVTSIVVENSRTVRRGQAVDPDLFKDQMDILLEEFQPDAVKIGLVGSPRQWEILDVYRKRLPDIPWVVDPVILSGSGSVLSESMRGAEISLDVLRTMSYITPNGEEAAKLLGIPAPADRAGWEAIAQRLIGPSDLKVIVTGGHFPGALNHRDLYADSNGTQWIEAERSPTQPQREFHGTGCMYASALASLLARGLASAEAARKAKGWVIEVLNAQPEDPEGERGRRVGVVHPYAE